MTSYFWREGCLLVYWCRIEASRLEEEKPGVKNDTRRTESLDLLMNDVLFLSSLFRLLQFPSRPSPSRWSIQVVLHILHFGSISCFLQPTWQLAPLHRRQHLVNTPCHFLSQILSLDFFEIFVRHGCRVGLSSSLHGFVCHAQVRKAWESPFFQACW